MSKQFGEGTVGKHRPSIETIFYLNKIGKAMKKSKPHKPFIKDFILANPSCTSAEVRRMTGAQLDSIHSVFTMLRKVYKTAGINSAGLVAPEGYPPITTADFEALCASRRNKTRRRKIKLVKKPIDLTAQPVPMPKPSKSNLLTDAEIQSMFAYVSGKVDGLREAGGKADLAVMLVRNVEQWYGLR
jgi:hypothetical protein